MHPPDAIAHDRPTLLPSAPEREAKGENSGGLFIQCSKPNPRGPERPLCPLPTSVLLPHPPWCDLGTWQCPPWGWLYRRLLMEAHTDSAFTPSSLEEGRDSQAYCTPACTPGPTPSSGVGRAGLFFPVVLCPETG